jgi:hypothetical protein
MTRPERIAMVDRSRSDLSVRRLVVPRLGPPLGFIDDESLGARPACYPQRFWHRQMT